MQLPIDLSKGCRMLKHIYNLTDFQAPAKQRLPLQLYSYIANGADDEKSMAHNRSAFDNWVFTPRMLQDVSARSQHIEIFGHRYDSPFGISPVGLAAMWCYRGDLVLAQTAQHHNIPAIMSGASLIPMEDVAQAAPNTWFQAYLPGETDRIQALVQRVKKAGFPVLVLTVDLPVSVNPERYAKYGFSSPLKPSVGLAWQGLTHPRWLMGTFLRTLLNHGMPHFENWRAERGAPILSPTVQRDFGARDHLSWDHIKTVRALWDGPLVLKGIMRKEDALHAKQLGIDGLIISNHGGRQLDSSCSPLTVLPEIAEACQGQITLMIDSGFRRGTDVLKALALGAECVFNGRSFNFAASVASAEGVSHAIQILRTEIHRNMAHLGINRLKDIDSSLLRPVS